MRPVALLAYALLPLLAAAQSSQQNSTQQGSQAQNASVVLSTSFTTGITLGPGRVESTFTSGVVFTITPAPQPTGNNTSNGNSTASGGSSSNSTSSKPTSTGPLPTAATDINGGGGPNGAPSPGASGAMYGPDDSFTNSVTAMQINTALLVLGGMAFGSAMVLM
ncbi:hypothetical protein K474DRAFT_1770678 [Panus rudis PR-1116 ss-1]|nr:hypothetical protein K474DRAFT_1770678 [Panus rudis PR-1116 ss-1]